MLSDWLGAPLQPMTILFFLLLAAACLIVLRRMRYLQRQLQALRQQAAQQSRATQDFLSVAGDWFWELDAEGRIVRCTEALQPLLGFAPLSLYGLHWQQLQGTRGAPQASAQLAALLAAGQPFRKQVLLLHCPDGVERHIELSAVPVRDAQGRLTGYRGAGRDVSEAQQLQTALRQGKQDLGLSLSQQALALIEARLAAEQAWQTQNRLLANVSHELLTPLHGMLNFAEMARLKLARGDVGRVAEHLANIAANGQRLQYQLNGLIDLAALSGGRRPFHWQSLNLRLLAETCLAQYEPAISQQRLLVELHSHPLPRLVADHGSISQLLSHLLGNAVRFSPPGGLIRIDIDRLADRVMLRISDQGPGVAAADADRIFEAFERGDSSNGHSGLGLAICRRIVEAHAGTLSLLPAAQGACFEVTLPFVAGQVLEPPPQALVPAPLAR